MNNIIGIINNTKEEKNLGDITKNRSVATIPYGGRYRLIDFHLSNMVNSGIQNVGILVRNNYRSVISHIRSPKEWDLDRKNDGIFILPPDNENRVWMNLRGDLEVLKGNMDYIVRSKQEYVLITDAKIICNIDYNEFIDYHIENKNDITVIYKNSQDDVKDILSYTQVQLGENNRVTNMEVNTNKINGGNVSLEMYIMSKELFTDMTYACVGRGEYDLVKDVIIKNLDKLKVYGKEFKGHIANINSVKNYYRHTMELLNEDIWQEMFFSNGSIYTKVKDLAPTKYGVYSNVKNALTANGCVIDGDVSGSIIFRNVNIKKGCVIKDSIIMQGTEIDEGAILENVIVDKDCYIGKNQKIIGSKGYPIVIEKKTIV